MTLRINPALRHVSTSISDGTHGTFDRVLDGVPLLSAKNVVGGGLAIGDTESKVSIADYREIAKNGTFAKGDVLLTIVGTIGRVALLETDDAVAFQRSVASIRPSEKVNGRYLYWALQAMPVQEDLLGRVRQAAQAGVYLGDVAAVRIPMPACIQEQRRIADFLEDQVTLLDKAIALRQQQIDLLKQAEASVVHEYLEARTSWPITPIKFLVSLLTSGPRGWGDFVTETGTPFLRIANVPARGITLREDNIQTVTAPPGPERQRSRTCAGDVLVSITADLGSVAVVPASAADGNVSQHVALLRPTAACTSEFLAWSIRAPKAQYLLRASGAGGTKVGLGLADVGNLGIRLPSRQEQGRVVQVISSRLAADDRLVSLMSEQCDLIQERKQSLITAAVTGEFDVTSARRVSA